MIRQLFNADYRTLRHRLAIVGFGVLAAIIAYFTLSISHTNLADGRISDKVLHFVGFAGLVLPVAVLNWRALLWALPLAVLFGGAIEMIQPSFGRDGDLMDFVADSGGVAFGTVLGLAIRATVLWARRG